MAENQCAASLAVIRMPRFFSGRRYSGAPGHRAGGHHGARGKLKLATWAISHMKGSRQWLGIIRPRFCQAGREAGAPDTVPADITAQE